MVVKNNSMTVRGAKFIKVSAATFKELAAKGYTCVVAGDAVPDKVSGFKDSGAGIINIECVPYKVAPAEKKRQHHQYDLPSNALNEMLCREWDYVIHKSYLGL